MQTDSTDLASRLRQEYHPAHFLYRFQGTAVTRERVIKSSFLKAGPGGTRTAVTSFSSRSAKTLSVLLARLDYSAASFLTLTHSSQHPISPGRYKTILTDSWAKTVRRRFPGFSAVWRLEKQGNGEPHFHLLLYGVSCTMDNFVFLRDAWHQALDIPVAPRIDFKPIRSGTGAYLYLAGHHAKRSQTWQGQAVGRYWGVLGRKNLPFLTEKTAILSQEADRVLAAIFAKKEARRVAWYASKGVTVEPRVWELAVSKLFARDPWPILVRYCRRKKIRIFTKNP